MAGKGDWSRPRDDKKYGKGYEEAFGKKCGINHQHDENCTKKEKENKK